MFDPMRGRLDTYLKFHNLVAVGVLGQGKD
jgi:hypothetical protein